jgi:hypothetical protein
MQLNGPLFPAFSPSEGEKEKGHGVTSSSVNSELWSETERNPLSPSDGERVRERGWFNGILTVKTCYLRLVDSMCRLLSSLLSYRDIAGPIHCEV